MRCNSISRFAIDDGPSIQGNPVTASRMLILV